MKTLHANGANIPAIGLGTFNAHGDQCVEVVSHALKNGCPHIDTAAFYENEEAVGEGIKASGKARDDVFVTTKVWPTEISDGNFQRSVEASLKRLDLEYVDLLLIHWPPKNDDIKGWAAMLNDVAERGMTKNIGVSNFTTSLLHRIVEASERPISANQVENHPFLDQSKVRSACDELGVALIAYCPIYRGGELFETPAVKQAAQAHGKSLAQIVLRWHVQHPNAGAIPKTVTPSRVLENIDVFDFELSETEMTAISALGSANNRICDFEFSPNWDVA